MSTDSLTPRLLPGVSIGFIRHFVASHPTIVESSLTTKDLQDSIIRPETAGRSLPYIDLFIGQRGEDGNLFVGPATVFVSHAWSYLFADVIVNVMEKYEKMHPNSYFWFDLFNNIQDASSLDSKCFDWFCDAFRGSILGVGRVLVVLSPWNNPVPIGRAWCLLELSTAIMNQSSIELEVLLPNFDIEGLERGVREDFECLVQHLADVKAEHATAWLESDRDLIFEYIKKSEGGFARVNREVSRFLRDWYIKQIRRLVDLDSTVTDLALRGQAGNVFKMFGQYDEALAQFEAVLSVLLDTHNSDSLIVATVLSSIGDTHSLRGDHEKEFDYHSRALDLRKQFLPSGHPDIARSYNSMGTYYHAVGKYDKALEYFQNAISIGTVTLSQTHPDLAVFYFNAASSYNMMGFADEAFGHYQRSLTIHPSNSLKVSNCYLGIGGALQVRGDYEQALKFFNSSLSIRLQILGSDHPFIATVYTNIASLHYAKGEYACALSHYERALSIRIAALGHDHSEVASSYCEAGSALLASGLFDRALDYGKRALTIRLNVFGSDHPDLAWSYLMLACVYNALKNYDRVVECIERAITIRTSALGEDHPEVLSAYSQAARLHRANFDHYRHIECEKKILSFKSKSLGPDNPEVLSQRKAIRRMSALLSKEILDLIAEQPTSIVIPLHEHTLEKCDSVYDGSYLCDVCQENGIGTAYHCLQCGFDSHPYCCCAEVQRRLDDILVDSLTRF